MLKDFTVIEIVKTIGPLSVIIEPNKLRFVKAVVEAMEYTPYVRYLVDNKGKRFAIQLCKEKDTQAVKFSKPIAEQGAKAVLYQNQELVDVIRGLMPEWGADKKYSVTGVYSKSDKAVVFDIKEAEEYSRRINRYE
jgi:hypothetical protein